LLAWSDLYFATKKERIFIVLQILKM